jgi:hypothetical protein
LLLRCVLRGKFIKNGNKAILHNRAPDGTNSQSIRQRIVNGKVRVRIKTHGLPIYAAQTEMLCSGFRLDVIKAAHVGAGVDFSKRPCVDSEFRHSCCSSIRRWRAGLIFRRQPRFGGGDHGLEAGIVAERIEVWIDLGVV